MFRRIILLVAVIALTLVFVTCAAPASCAASASGTGGCANPTQAALATQTVLASPLAATNTPSTRGPTPTPPGYGPTSTPVSATATPIPDPPPVVTITSPVDKTYISAGYSPFPVTFSGSATGAGLGELSWWDTHGFVTNVLAGKGPNVTLQLVAQNVGSSCLPPTTHTISLHVTDAYGRTATAVITVYVGPYCIH
jgi:hypothetical protein